MKVWNDEAQDWIPNAENRAKQRERQAELNAKKCHECDCVLVNAP
jgi:hypothetical protein